MRALSAFSAAAMLLAATTLPAQTVNGGRGDLPLRVPAGYDGSAPVPLVVLLHGYTSSGAGQDAYFGLSKLVDRYGFIMVAPDGTEEASEKKPRFWNASPSCCNFQRSTVDDSAYLAALIARVKSSHKIDPKRVFLIGHSNGGFMAYRMAHEHSGTIAAIASLAGADQGGPAGGAPQPVHVLQIHGTADTVIRYDGGAFRGGEGHPGARASVEAWAGRNGCAIAGETVGTLDLEAKLAGAESEVVRYTSGCKAGGSAELWTIAGGGHVPALSAHFTALVVEWLLGHPKP